MDLSHEDSPRAARADARACRVALAVALAVAPAALAGPMMSSRPVPPGPVDFGSGPVGATNYHSLSVSEVGDATLVLTDPLLSDTATFSVLTSFPVSIANGSRPTAIDLGCTPGTEGRHTATLSFSTNDPYFPEVSYQLVCTGAPGAVAPGFRSTPAAPGPIELGSGPTGTLNEQVVFVEEAGTEDLEVSSPLLGGDHPGDFSVSTVFPFTVQEGGARGAVTVSCTPTALGPRSATLTVQTNDPTKPSVVFDLACVGTSGGVTPGFSSRPAVPGPLLFEAGDPGVPVGRMMLLEERGSGTLTVSSPLLSGPGASQFGVTTTFPLDLVDGSWGASLRVHCVPPVSDADSAILVLQTNDPATPSVEYQLECGTDIFVDDFESGGTSDWSTTAS